MKIIVGLLLLATALAYPLAENEEKPKQPVAAEQKPAESQSALIPDQPILLPEQQPQIQEKPVHDSSESSESEESKEKSSEQKPVEAASDEKDSDEKLETKREEKQEESIKEPIKEELKPSEPLPALKITEPSLPAEEPKKPETVIQEISGKSIPAEPQEKPLALPTLIAEEKIKEEGLKVAATEIKEEAALPSEQKVEVSPAAEEKLPELRKTDVDEKVEAPVVPSPSVPVIDAEIKPEGEKKAKAEEIKVEEKVEEKREEKPIETKALEPTLDAAKPIDEKPALEEAKPLIERPKKLEGAKPEELKPIEVKPAEAKPVEEKLPEPSASSS